MKFGVIKEHEGERVTNLAVAQAFMDLCDQYEHLDTCTIVRMIELEGRSRVRLSEINSCGRCDDE